MRLLLSPLILVTAAAAPAQERARTVQLDNRSADDVLAISGRLIDAGRFDQAQTLLDRLAADRAGGVERDFLDGMAALARQDFRKAERMFRKILAGNPRLVRVRLELARALFLMKQDEQADYNFKLAIAEHPPAMVIRNIARFREAIRARRSWRFNVTLGIAPDTNINASTDREKVDILGLPFELDPQARARSGVGAIGAADANVRIDRGGMLPIYVGAYGRATRFGDRTLNDSHIGGELGPEIRLFGGRLRVAATGFKRWYGGDALVASLGGRLTFDKVIGGKWAIEASAGTRGNDYARRTDLDGWDFDMIFQANRTLGASTLGFGWVSAQRSIAEDPANSFGQGRIGVGVLKEILWGLRPQLSAEIGRQVHDRPLAIFGGTRKDWRSQVTASIYKRDWNVLGFAPSVRVTYMRNVSTLDLFDQKRLRTEFGLAKAF